MDRQLKNEEIDKIISKLKKEKKKLYWFMEYLIFYI